MQSQHCDSRVVKHGNGEIITNKSHAILNINEIPRVDSNQSVSDSYQN